MIQSTANRKDGKNMESIIDFFVSQKRLRNAMWPYEFQNSVLITDGYANRKVYKARPQEKIDNVVALCDALAVFDFTEMRVMQVSEE